ncbi:hypothetical protein SAG0066_01240 [Streptococcus agalactiae CCUG 38383]|nr:hypothetical protein SAG0066_01240 [Streptococcus agalactiae CCUG 38383]
MMKKKTVNITTSTILKPFEQKKIVEDFNPYSNLDNLEIKKIRLNGSQKITGKN